MTSDLHVRDLGAGPTILLVHAGICDGSGWLPVTEQLAARGWRVLVPDVRGFGQSPDPAGPFDHAEDLAQVLRDADAETAVVIGWSMGGGLACALAHEHPGLVARLALVNSVPPGFERDPAVGEAWVREEALWEAGDLDALAHNDVLTWAVGRGRTHAETPEPVCELVAATALDQASRYSEDFDEFDRTEVTADDVRALGMLELVVGSEHDYPDVRDAAGSLGVDYLEIPGCGHAGPFERPDAYAAALLSWLGEPGD